LLVSVRCDAWFLLAGLALSSAVMSGCPAVAAARLRLSVGYVRMDRMPAVPETSAGPADPAVTNDWQFVLAWDAIVAGAVVLGYVAGQWFWYHRLDVSTLVGTGIGAAAGTTIMAVWCRLGQRY
jgi:hypothetical protein